MQCPLNKSRGYPLTAYLTEQTLCSVPPICTLDASGCLDGTVPPMQCHFCSMRFAYCIQNQKPLSKRTTFLHLSVPPLDPDCAPRIVPSVGHGHPFAAIMPYAPFHMFVHSVVFATQLVVDVSESHAFITRLLFDPLALCHTLSSITQECIRAFDNQIIGRLVVHIHPLHTGVMVKIVLSVDIAQHAVHVAIFARGYYNIIRTAIWWRIGVCIESKPAHVG